MDIIKKLVYDYLRADGSLSDRDLLTLISFRLEDDYEDRLEEFLAYSNIETIVDLKKVVLEYRGAYNATFK